MKTIITKNTKTNELYALAFIIDKDYINRLSTYTYNKDNVIYTVSKEAQMTFIDVTNRTELISQVIITDNDINIINNLPYIRTYQYNFEPCIIEINNKCYVDDLHFIVYSDMLRT